MNNDKKPHILNYTHFSVIDIPPVAMPNSCAKCSGHISTVAREILANNVSQKVISIPAISKIVQNSPLIDNVLEKIRKSNLETSKKESNYNTEESKLILGDKASFGRIPIDLSSKISLFKLSSPPIQQSNSISSTPSGKSTASTPTKKQDNRLIDKPVEPIQNISFKNTQKKKAANTPPLDNSTPKKKIE